MKLTGVGLMSAFRVEEDMPIESSMPTRSLKRVQNKMFKYD